MKKKIITEILVIKEMRKCLLDYDVNLFFKFLFLSIYVVTVDFVFIQKLFSKINLVFFLDYL